MDLKGCVALITGASRGIGRAVAVALARQGVHVCVLARSHDALCETEEQCKSYGVKTLAVCTDITDDREMEAAVGSCVEHLGGLNILVNNAGIYSPDVDTCMALNFRGSVTATNLALPHIELGAQAEKPSAIVFISSIAAKISRKGGAGYCSSKRAIVGYAECLFEDIREKGIKVSSILPGFVKTDMISKLRSLDREKMLQPDDIASAVLFVCKCPGTGCPVEITMRPQRTPYMNM